MFRRFLLGGCALLALVTAAGAAAHADISRQATLVVPHTGHGLDFDDMAAAPSLHRVLVPAAQSGALALIDPASGRLQRWPHVVPPGSGADRDDAGTTSAAVGAGLVFVSDHQDRTVVALDPSSHREVARAPLAAGPDYVRYVAPLHQLWVTEPGRAQIERFAVHGGSHPRLRRLGVIAVPGGPEALVIDAADHAAYTNEWKHHTLRIDLRSLHITARWANGCRGSRGLALAPARHVLFVGCKEGRVAALDLRHDGRVLAQARVGAGVDIIAWNRHRQHLYVPGARSATLSVLAWHGRQLQTLATLPAAAHSHCVATDGRDHAYVCDPGRGAVLVYRDGR